MSKKKQKKFLCMLLSFCMVFIIIFPVVSYAGEDVIELQAVTDYEMGTTVSGAITETSQGQEYRFQLNESGRVNFSFIGNMERISVALYDSNETELWRYSYHYWNSSTKKNTINASSDLLKGSYKILIEKEGKYTGTYALKMDFVSAKESFTETKDDNNDAIDRADSIAFGTAYKGQIACNEEGDFYKFTMESSGTLGISFNGNMERISVYIYDEAGQEVWGYGYHYWDSSAEKNVLNETIHLLKGSYTFIVEKENKYTGNYDLKLDFASAGESFTETKADNNDSMSQADAVMFGTAYKGQIARNEEGDFYKFTMESSGALRLNFSGNMERISVYIYNEAEQEVWEEYSHFWNSSTNKNNIEETIHLLKGSYTVKIEKRNNYTGNYDLKLDFTSAKESFTETMTANNNSIATASPITAGTTYAGQIAQNDDKDFYAITLQQAITYQVYFRGNIPSIRLRLFDAAGNEIWTEYHSWKEETGLNIIEKEYAFAAGTYYLEVERNSGAGNYTVFVGVEVPPEPIDPSNPDSQQPSGDFKFQDVKGEDWYYEAVKYVYVNQLMTGLNELTFGPVNNLARAQFAVILHRMNGEPAMAYQAKFPDVKDGQWYTNAILWANSIGVVKGYEHNGLFGTADNINREQMAVMMYRYAQYKKYDTSQKIDFAGYTDAKKVNAFASEAMKWAVGSGIITGKDNGTRLDPQGNASRAECATIIMRFVEKYGIK